MPQDSVPETGLLFFDVEASSLGKCSFPIEIGWCNVDGLGEAHLIRPNPDWTEWSPASERIHGISREQLAAEGEPVGLVARRAAAALANEGHAVLSDAVTYDQTWLDRLLAAGGSGVPIHLFDMWRTLGCRVVNTLSAAGVPDRFAPASLHAILMDAQRADKRRGQIPHRALPDAQRNALIWRDAMRCAGDVAAAWQAMQPRC
jgi:hypothetical protein